MHIRKDMEGRMGRRRRRKRRRRRRRRDLLFY